MNFAALLTENNIDPRDVLVLRHRPFEPELRKVLPWLAAEKPDVYNAYQQTQGEKLEPPAPLHDRRRDEEARGDLLLPIPLSIRVLKARN